MIFKCETKLSSDSSTNWLLFAIHADKQRQCQDTELGFLAKLGLWLKGKL